MKRGSKTVMTRLQHSSPATATPASGRRHRFVFTLLLMLFATATAWADNVNYYDPTAAVGQQMKQADATLITKETTTLGTMPTAMVKMTQMETASRSMVLST